MNVKPGTTPNPKAEAAVSEGALLWTPPAEFVNQSELTKFIAWLRENKGLQFDSYDALWRWSTDELNEFWAAVWDYFEIMSDTLPKHICCGQDMLLATWFEGCRVNYAEHLLRHESSALPDTPALLHSTETRSVESVTWSELGHKVRRMATNLRALGLEPGDRVVSYMPNTPETVIAMIATIAIGAVWSSSAPEFGRKTVVDRFAQIEPKLAFLSDGYSFNGKIFNRQDDLEFIVSQLPSLKHIVWFDFMEIGYSLKTDIPIVTFEDAISGDAVSVADFSYTRVPGDHPLWVLYSSGTTGLPKAITHGHAGMIVEHLKMMALHCNLGPSKRMFFYSTTGWMMWNSVVSALLTGASAVLYDGSPVHGGLDMLWRMAEETRATLFGASPTLVANMKKAGVVPRKSFDLSALDTIIVGGSPSTPETFKWFYDDVKDDLWVTSQSGGTDLCSGLVVGVPSLPVYAGEIQGRALGIAVDVWNDQGQSLTDATGELVVTKPFPSAPLFFWGDEDKMRYRQSYFDTYPGVWRHGDLAMINARGGAYVFGRSDSTLNRYGVRIGTAEIYRVIEQIEDIADCLIVSIETPNGGYYMPLFLTLAQGCEFSNELKSKITQRLRTEASPRHVPDEIIAVPKIPYTLSGKKMEIPVRKLIMGAPLERAASIDAMADPTAMHWFVDFAAQPKIVALQSRTHAKTS